MRLSFSKRILRVCSVGLALSGLGGPAWAELAEDCANAAKPLAGNHQGVDWYQLDPELAIPLCQQAVLANSQDHASIAHLARAHSKAGNKTEMARLLTGILDTDDPDALAYIAVMLEDGAPEVAADPQRALDYGLRAAEAGNTYAMYRLAPLLADDAYPFYDLDQSEYWLTQAIDGGNPYAFDLKADRLRDSEADDAEEQAFVWYERAANAGRTAAHADLARAYRWGKGVAQNYGKAVEHFTLCASNNRSFCSYYLALMYRDGLGVEKDPDQAEELLHQARAQGREFSEFQFYLLWDEGDQIDRALPYLHTAVEQGDPVAISELARLTSVGLHVPKDIDAAIDLYLKAADLGRRDDLWNGWFQITQNRKDRIPELLPRIRAMAASGEPDAQERMGNAYEFGRGVPKDYAEAARYYHLAAQVGDPYAENGLARLIHWGATGFWDPTLAARLFQKAADQGHDEAAIKLANMHIDGEGVPKDFARVIQLATAPAAKGDARAQFALAFAHANASGSDRDIKAAVDWYRKAALNDKPKDDGKRASVALGEMYEQGLGVEQDPAKAREWFARAATQDSAKGKYKTALYLIQYATTPEALTKAASYLAEAADEGQAEALTRLEQGFDGINDPLHPVLIAPSPDLATWFETLGRGFEEVRIDCAIILTDCGRVGRQQLDLAAAARWYRRASMHRSAQFRLGRLLLAHPNLAQVDNEGATILAALDMPETRILTDVTGKNADAAFEQALEGVDPSAAVRVAALSAIGRYGDAAMGPGWHWLQSRSDTLPEARTGLLGVALFLGAFEQATKQLAQVPEDVTLDLEDFDYSLSQALRFLMQNVRKGVTPDPEVLDQIDALLTAFSAHDTERSSELRLMLDEVRIRLAQRDHVTQNSPASQKPLGERIAHLENRIETKFTGTAFSPIIVPLFQQLAILQREAGDLAQAKKSVFHSIAYARSMNDATRHLEGSLVYHMEMACWLRKGSDLLFTLGDDAAGLTLAKASVNELQQARGRLVGLPQDLQNCFRDLLSTQYRRMTDLLIRHDHLNEAQWVLAQLKDLETYQYANQNSANAGRAFDAMPMSAAQTTTMERIHGLSLAKLVDLRGQLAELEGQKESAEAARLQTQYEQAQSALADSLDALSDLAAAQDGIDESAIPDEITARSLRRLGGRLKRLDGVAMVYSVSLPETTHFLIVTAEGTEHREIPLPQAQLNDHINRLRAALSDPRKDPIGPAQEFYRVVWAGVEEALDAAGTDHVLLSLDGLMRYVPIVALHDTQGWLLGRRDYVTFTTASRDLLLDDEILENLSVEAFGASRGGAGFTPLPFVQQEVQQIAGDQGQLTGRTWLDAEFDDQTFARGLQSGTPVVHIATHFHLTDREDSSAMLLGNGETLSVATLKANARRGKFDLADVQLLVLSACQTALAKGGELESFAATLQWEGVRSVIATLWPVADRSTSDFMVGFYKELKQGKSRALALRTIQQRFAGSERASETGPLRTGVALQTARKGARLLPGVQHPFYWAGFQLIGQWR